MLDKLLPSKDELIPIDNPNNTFYECGFNYEFDNLSFEKQLQVICDLVRQSIYPSRFPHPNDGIKDLIGNCYTAAYVSKLYLEKLGIGKNVKIVFGRARTFEPDDNNTIHLLNLVEDYNGNVYQFDATPFVGYGLGVVKPLSQPIYQEYVEVSTDIEKYINFFVKIIYEDHVGMLNSNMITTYLQIIKEALTIDILKGYCSKGFMVISNYLNGYEKENILKLVSSINKYSKTNVDDYNKRIQLINLEIEKWQEELLDLKYSNVDIKRQGELARNIIQEKKMFDSSYERFADIRNKKYRLSFINPRVLKELEVNSIMIKPSAYFIGKEQYIKEQMLYPNKRKFGEYSIDLSKPTEQTGIKPMLFSHPLGEDYIRSMMGTSTIMLVNDDADNLYKKKKNIRSTLCDDMWYKSIKWVDNEDILWHPYVTNLIHSTDDYSEAALHYLIGFPEHQAMTRFMYPNKKLVRKL